MNTTEKIPRIRSEKNKIAFFVRIDEKLKTKLIEAVKVSGLSASQIAREALERETYNILRRKSADVPTASQTLEE
jgi:hypothetical protein